MKKIELKEVEALELANALLREQLLRERLASASERREQVVLRLGLSYGLKPPLVVAADGATIEGMQADALPEPETPKGQKHDGKKQNGASLKPR